MEDKENILGSLNSSSDNVGVAQAKYEVEIKNVVFIYTLTWMGRCILMNTETHWKSQNKVFKGISYFFSKS